MRLTLNEHAKVLVTVAVISGLGALMLGTEYAPQVPGVVLPLWCLSGISLFLSLVGGIYCRRPLSKRGRQQDS